MLFLPPTKWEILFWILSGILFWYTVILIITGGRIAELILELGIILLIMALAVTVTIKEWEG
jgi:hypothetical protein